MNNFRTYELAIKFYEECRIIKISNKVLRDQFERASLSIVLNIAEGYGRITEKDRRKFYSIAFGSLRETQCLLRLLKENSLYRKSDQLAAYLYRLLREPGCLPI